MNISPIKRRTSLGLPETSHAAHAVRYLLEQDAAKATGTVVTFDGGATA